MLTDGPLTIERKDDKSTTTLIFSLSGPLTLRNLFEFQTELRTMQPTGLTVIDLAAVPYMDSAGMGLVMNHYVHCQTRGTRVVVCGANSRIMDLFKVTKVDTILPLTATVEEADV